MAHLKACFRELESVFTVDTAGLKNITNHFVNELERGLGIVDGGIPMNPTWVMSYPTGYETGRYLVLDLGGTNLRVYGVALLGEKADFQVTQMQYRYKLPEELKTGDAEILWDFVTECLEAFLYSSNFDSGVNIDLSFIFSFPMTQPTIGEGILQRWTKGFNVANSEGRDAAEMLRVAIAKRGLPLNIRVMTNDTTATMMASAYMDPETAIGCVFGTGCNAAYLEDCQSIPKLCAEGLPAAAAMVINCEWGAFDNEHAVLPLTSFDIAIDNNSPRSGQQAFEKMVAGLYLGELFRLVVLDIHQRDTAGFLEGQDMEKLQEPYCLDSSVLSSIEEDTSGDLQGVYDLCLSRLAISPTYQELRFLKGAAKLITTRAARLSACGIAAICKKRGFQTCHVGVEGSLFEKHPYFKQRLSTALGEILDWPRAAKSCQDPVMFIPSPGSGVRAAVIASTLDRR